MKKIINGSRYDTDTAKCLGRDRSSSSASDFSYWEQELYRTKAEKYFVHKVSFGYPKSDGSFGWGEEIVPVSEAAARQWAEHHLSADEDEIEAIFAQDQDDARFTVVLPSSLLEELDKRKSADNVSRSEIVIDALRTYLKESR